MKVLIVFESRNGNTCRIAAAIGSGFADQDDVTVEPVAHVAPASLQADLLLVGGPIHSLGLPTPTSRRTAVDAAGQDPTLVLDEAAHGASLREWLNELPSRGGRAAVFDTRLDAPQLLTGHALAAIARRLKRRGYDMVVDPESFLVDRDTNLIDGELVRARRWGEALSAEVHTAGGEMADTNTVASRVQAYAD